jgi:hypothetical protein
MNTFAILINNIVSQIFTSDYTLTQVGEQLYNLNMVHIVDITAVNPQPQIGWIFDGTNFSPPVSELPTISQQIDAIGKQYSPQLDYLYAGAIRVYTRSVLSGVPVASSTAAAYSSEIAQLNAIILAAKGAVING